MRLSQAINDWYDRHVDAINERTAPSPPPRAGPVGPVHRRHLGRCCRWPLRPCSVCLGAGGHRRRLVLAWAYSAPPLPAQAQRLVGQRGLRLLVRGAGLGVTGAAAMLGGNLPASEILLLAVLYSIGAHGIMTLNDFKAIKGDSEMGIRSLPVSLGPQRAAQAASAIMLVPQLVVIALLLSWGRVVPAAVVAALVVGQALMMRRFLREPIAQALWYSGFACRCTCPA